MLTLYPKNSYVKNIGNSGTGTHSKKINKRYDVNLSKSFKFEKINVNENILARKKFEEFFKYNLKKRYIYIKMIKDFIMSIKMKL